MTLTTAWISQVSAEGLKTGIFALTQATLGVHLSQQLRADGGSLAIAVFCQAVNLSLTLFIYLFNFSEKHEETGSFKWNT